MKFRGNRWYKCDLHIHTPESKCFADENVTPEKWVQACIDKELDVVAVTDHNSGNYIDKIIEAAEGTELKVFPGVEITCDTSKIHLLILFDRDKRTSDINEFLHFCGIQKKDFANQHATTGTGENIFSIAQKALERGAIVIPAHIDEYNGISSASYQSMEKFLERSEITSAQVVNKEIYEDAYSKEQVLQLLKERYPEINSELLRSWTTAVNLAKDSKLAILTFSDNPKEQGESKHGLWGIGKRYTWIKMEEEVNIESLRQALLMPNQKIRNDFDFKSIPYVKPDLLIKGLNINNSILNTESAVSIQFSSQLSTIIGGRGTGKSSIQRIIRGLLGDNTDLSDFDDLYKEQRDFFKETNTSRLGEESGILSKETIIDLFIERFNHSYKISFFNFENDQFEKNVFKLNELQIYEETKDSVLELFPVEIYSQKQIYNIATKPNALREKIDQSIDSFENHFELIRECRGNYSLINSNIRDIKNTISRKSKIQLEKKDIKERLKIYTDAGYKELLAKRKNIEKDKLNLEKVVKDLRLKKDFIEGFFEEYNYIDFDEFEFSQLSEDELNQILNDNKLKFSITKTKIDEAKKILADTINSLTEEIKKSDWKSEYDEINNNYNSLQIELTSNQLNELENIENLSIKLISKDNELDAISKKEEELEELEIKSSEIFDEYLKLRKELTTSRSNFLNDVLSDVTNIKIDAKPFRDAVHFENELRRIMQRSDSFVDDYKKITSLIFNGLVEERIKEFRELILNIRETNVHNNRFSRKFNNLIEGLNDEQITEIKLLYPEDKIEVKYKANEASSYKSISNASAGQKTSAILTFLLSYGKEPLLLDQPEDDLDNQLIYDLIVERLADSKNKRQIIVISHNANIPVNGDAEWVTALDSESKGLQVLCEGSIENEDIKTAICNIMEGGKEAFSLRAKRYNFE